MNNKINIFLPFFCLFFFCTCLQARCDIIQLFGPPYSSPSVLQLLMNSNVSVSSQREFGTAIWTHHLQSATTKKNIINNK